MCAIGIIFFTLKQNYDENNLTQLVQVEKKKNQKKLKNKKKLKSNLKKKPQKKERGKKR